MIRTLPLLLLVGCVSPQAMEAGPWDAAPEDAGVHSDADSTPEGPLPPPADSGPGFGATVDAADEAAGSCSVTWLCVLYVTASPPGGDWTTFCPHAAGGAVSALAWEATMDYASFIDRVRPRVCAGQPQFTPLTLEVWKYDADGNHGTKAVSSQSCP